MFSFLLSLAALLACPHAHADAPAWTDAAVSMTIFEESEELDTTASTNESTVDPSKAEKDENENDNRLENSLSDDCLVEWPS